MRFGSLLFVLATVTLASCPAPPKECGEEDCKPICDPQVEAIQAELDAAGPTLTDFEQTMVEPVLEDIRSGVRPFGEQAVGVCKGSTSCDEYLGTDVGELPEGKYMVMAELRVPKIGEPGTWSITFDTVCESTRTTASGETTSSSNSSRSYDVRYAGENRGYRLMPLRTIESPSTGGSRKCTYTLTAPHPDGDKVYTGGWATPAAE